MTATCPTCRRPLPSPPPEPPIGTWVRDRFGATTMRQENGKWAPPGFMPLAAWDAMWHARGPLTTCGPWGNDD